MGLFNGILKTGPPCMFSYARGDQVLSLYVLASKDVICPVSSFLSSSNPLTPEVVPPSFGSDKSKEPSGDKVPALVFSSSSPLSVLRPESSSSLSNPALGLAGASSKLFELESSQKDGKSNGKLEPLSSGFSPSTLFAALSSTSSFSNGQLASSTAISSISFLTSSNSPRDVPSGSSSVVASSTSILAAVGSTTGNSITSSGGLSGFSAVSSVSTEPLISSGPSYVPPIVSTLSTTSSADNADLKTKATILATSIAVHLFSLFITGAQSLVSVQTCLAGSDNTTVSQTVPAHFGYSTKLPEVGNSGMTSFSSVGSSSSNTGLVSAAASASNPVGANADTFGNFSFGTSSSASSTMVNSVGPGSGTTQPAFAFGASPAHV
ncbi:putative serine-rich protein 13-like [Capsicum annuum]